MEAGSVSPSLSPFLFLFSPPSLSWVLPLLFLFVACTLTPLSMNPLPTASAHLIGLLFWSVLGSIDVVGLSFFFSAGIRRLGYLTFGVCPEGTAEDLSIQWWVSALLVL